MNKLVFVLLGKTGSGKSTILNMIREVKGKEIEKLPSYTTRPMRSNEKNSDEYFFITDDQFELMIEHDLLMEHRKYTQAQGDVWKYGTGFPKSNYSITTMTPDVIPTCMSVPGITVYPIYISIDSNLRYKRLEMREMHLDNPNFEEFKRRFQSDEERYTQKVLYDAGIRPENTFSNDGYAFNTTRNIIRYMDYIIDKDRKERMKEYANY